MRDEHTAEEVLDWICWSLVVDADTWYPPDETAEECIEALREGEPDDVEVKEQYERGYHAGSFLAAEDLAWTIVGKFGVDVYARAERHREESDLDLPPFDISHGDEGIRFLDEDYLDDRVPDRAED